jgi:hypothetical protein
VTHDNGSLSFYPSGIWIGWTALVAVVLATTMLLSGGILLLMRRLVGRWLILIGCVGAVANLFHPIFGSSYYYESVADLDYFLAVFPLFTAAFAFTPSTKRWCKSSRRGPAFGGPGEPG